MNIRKIFIIKVICWTILLCFILPSCSKKSGDSNKEQGSGQSAENSKKAPEQLTAMEENIEKIIKALGGPAASIKEEGQSQDKSQGQSQGQGQGQSQGQGQGQGQGQSQEQGGEKKTEQKKPESQDVWSQITPLITELHFKWNDFIPMASKVGANNKLIESYSNSLNNLTTVVETKNNMNALIASSNLYGILPDFYSLYSSTDKTSPELKRVKHHVRNAIISSMNNNWTQSDIDINLIDSAWTICKNSIPKEQQEIQSKLDTSIYEFEKVEKEKNQKLTELKGKIVINNIDSLEKALKSSESSGGSSGKSNGGSSGSSGSSSGGSS